MLEADFRQQDEDKGETPLQPRDHGLQLWQGRGRGGRLLLAFLPGAASLLLQQGRGAVLQGVVVVEVLVVVVEVLVVLGWTGQERPSLRTVGSTFLSGRGHLNEDFRGGRAQRQTGHLELSGGDGGRRNPHQAREELLVWGGWGVRLQAVKHSTVVQTATVRTQSLTSAPVRTQGPI